MVWLLLAVYQLKHFVADYPLQTPYMLKKFLPGKDFIKPLAAHAGVHALFTLLIALAVNPKLAIPLALLDFVVHFIVDRIKASPKMLGKYKSLSAGEFKTLNDEIVSIKKLSPGSSYELWKINKQFKHNKYFWLALGADQMCHHLTHYIIIYLLIL